MCVFLSGLISQPFLDEIPPNLVCELITLTARGAQGFGQDFGHVAFYRSQLVTITSYRVKIVNLPGKKLVYRAKVSGQTGAAKLPSTARETTVS